MPLLAGRPAYNCIRFKITFYGSELVLQVSFFTTILLSKERALVTEDELKTSFVKVVYV